MGFKDTSMWPRLNGSSQLKQRPFMRRSCYSAKLNRRTPETNVRCFLSKHACVPCPPSLLLSLTTWQILFQFDDLIAGTDSSPAVVALDVVEEDVTRSRSVYYDQCRVVGWSGHPVCRKGFHFIIRASGSPTEGYQKCSVCGDMLQLWDSRCKSCNSVITADDLEDWVYLQLEDTTHLLHGVIHSNGYGHLLTLNGREGGSKVLSGCDIMNFWDRLCLTLAVRKVSVMDASKKYGLEYRLLHAITRGHPWYGDWGYEFGAGSYALTLDTYHEAVYALSSMPLSCFLYQGRKPRTRLQAVIEFYQSLSDSDLVTLKDLFSFLLRLIHETHKPRAASKKSTFSNPNISCAWTRNDVEGVEQAMFKVLLAATGNSSWVTRRALKGAMCKVASPKLLNYCLKYLGGKVASNGMIVQTRCNPSSDAIEFRLELLSCVPSVTGLDSNYPPREHIIRDLKFLYDSILHPQTMVHYRPQPTGELMANSAAKLLDCKQFVKDYKPDKMSVANPFTIHFWCHVELADELKDDLVVPPELIVLPSNATVADLKSEATKAFQEVYAIFKRFQTKELLDYGPLNDSMTQIFGWIKWISPSTM
ncbi:hypothetical protein L1049_026335 [Liquidambar formosana]|uniref:Uncharacterized protein n=1 Tax=Liquidambar formosana TaxID=63359 RepID=A0AAP0NCJ6_LIQFO